MRRVRLGTIQQVLNVGLLTAVLLIATAPLFGVNPAALTAVHTHVYFGEADADHDHHAHVHHNAHKQIIGDINPLELMRLLQDGIALLPDQSISQLGFFYVALLWLASGMILFNTLHFESIKGDHWRTVKLRTISPLDKPPTSS